MEQVEPSKTILEKTSFFRQVVNDAIKMINSGTNGYCFNEEQLEDIKSHFNCPLKVKDVDGIYYVRKYRKGKGDSNGLRED